MELNKLVTPTLVLRQSQMFDLNTEMWVYVETVKYMKVPNFYEGVLCVYSTYYVYNLEYDKKVAQLFEFFDELITPKSPPSTKKAKSGKMTFALL